MTTIFHHLFRNHQVELRMDSKGHMELDVEDPNRYYFELTQVPQDALDLATRIIYVLWTSDPDLAEERVSELAEGIPYIYNLMEKHRRHGETS